MGAETADTECLVGEDNQVVASWKSGEDRVFQDGDVAKARGKMSQEDWPLIPWPGDHWDFSGSTLSVAVKAAVSGRARDWESKYR